MSRKQFINIPVLKADFDSGEVIFETNDISLEFFSKPLKESQVNPHAFYICFEESKLSINHQPKKGSDATLVAQRKSSSGLSLETLAYLLYTEIKYSYEVAVETNIVFQNHSPTRKYLDNYDVESEALISIIEQIITENMNVKRRVPNKGFLIDRYGNVIIPEEYLSVKTDKKESKKSRDDLFAITERKFGLNLTMQKAKEERVFYKRKLPVRERSFIDQLFNYRELNDIERTEIHRTFQEADGKRMDIERRAREEKRRARQRDFERAVETGKAKYKNPLTGVVLSHDRLGLFIESGRINVEDKLTFDEDKGEVARRNRLKRYLKNNKIISDDGVFIRCYYPEDWDDIALLVDLKYKFDKRDYIESESGEYRDLSNDWEFIIAW